MDTVDRGSRRDRLVTSAIIIVVVIGSRLLGDRAWWVVPPLFFTAAIVQFLLDGRRRLTLGWVLFAAGAAIVLGAFLRLTQ
jgi:hypothetical protein